MLAWHSSTTMQCPASDGFFGLLTHWPGLEIALLFFCSRSYSQQEGMQQVEVGFSCTNSLNMLIPSVLRPLHGFAALCRLPEVRRNCHFVFTRYPHAER